MSDVGDVIRVLLADDHPLVQEGLCHRLEGHEGIKVVGVASSGGELLELASTVEADVVVTDISLPDKNGLDICKLLKERTSNLKVLVLTMHDNKEYIRRAVACGADGYLLKDTPADQLMIAIRELYRGHSYFGPSVSKVLLAEEESKLTERETDILLLLLEGLSNREIGDRLGISTRTVESHRSNIYLKLDTHSLAGLFKYALDHGLLELK